MQVVIFASLLSLLVESMPEAQSYAPWFRRAELVFLAVFGAEYCVRLVRGMNAWSFFGIVDALTVASLVISLYDLPASLRGLDILRWVVLGKMLRYTVVDDHLTRAFLRVRKELGSLIVLIGITLLVASTGIYYAEHSAQPDKFASIPHSLWWAVVTITTVGYGDVFPVTALGKWIAGFVMFSGVFIIAIPIAFWTSAVIDVMREDKEKENS